MSSDQRIFDHTSFLEPRQILLARQQASFDMGSPTLIGLEPCVMSPVSSLALDLNSASLMDTPRKRLSLSSTCSSTCSTPNTDPSSEDLYESTAKRVAQPLSDKENLIGSDLSAANGSLTFSPGKAAVLLGSPTRRGTLCPSGSPSRRGLSIQSPSKTNIMLNYGSAVCSPVKFSPPKSPSSQDSGYLGDDYDSEFKLPTLSKRSPRTLKESRSQLRLLSRKFSSVSSEEEDGFSAILESDEETVVDPADKFTTLLSAPINASQSSASAHNNEPLVDAPYVSERTIYKPASRIFASRQSIRRCLSMVETTTTASPMISSPLSSRIFLESIAESPQPVCFKRPEPPRGHSSPVQNKRRKSDTQENVSPECAKAAPPPCKSSHVKKLFRSHSESNFSHHTIMRAVQSFSDNTDLIGDCTRPYALPLVAGKHPELKTISCHTLADLVSGRYNDTVSSFTIVDCRFPYEFEGGHVQDAKNLWSKDMIFSDFLENRGVARVPPCPTPELAVELRDVVIFHCEFSSERGPNLSRFLRNKDRDANKEHYPALHWPEIYLLEGGYKEFYTYYKEMCEPRAYMPMLTEGYENDLKIFRAKAKTFSNDSGRQARTGQVRLKRLGL